jgi:hypothetical protein
LNLVTFITVAAMVAPAIQFLLFGLVPRVHRR